MVVKYALHSDDVCGVCGPSAHSGHNSDEHMLLDGERARRKLGTKDLDVRQNPCETAAEREGDKRCHKTTDTNGWVSKEAAIVERSARGLLCARSEERRVGKSV